MTVRCVRCHRTLKHPTESGLGPVCGKRAKPIQIVERDLFGFNITLAAEAATVRVMVHVESMAIDAVIAIRHEAAAARRRLGVWT
jgi:hypothetical protein